ncbi:hypothetical protein BN2497_12755 [Janthinobacterium sp. CG23_2]|nr:hypothetical protein BN2497_12755 [Janthinobacterium sp. CG23_2]CUU32775.1 hypothetical protein BN3177_12755 [Janthinobacterium sp. CG23_2]
MTAARAQGPYSADKRSWQVGISLRQFVPMNKNRHFALIYVFMEIDMHALLP